MILALKLQLLGWLFLPMLSSCTESKINENPEEKEVARIIKALSSDEMQGRAAFTKGAEKAATFIENEFRQIGLLPLNGEKSFRQVFYKGDVTNEGSEDKRPLFNVAGMLPGKSKPEEIVVISAHYDHIGIIEPLQGDSIANGADDDASGVTAVISLANIIRSLIIMHGP